MKKMKQKISLLLINSIKKIIDDARQEVVRTANLKMVAAYYMIGKLIVENEQQGKSKADYAAYTLATISQHLTIEYGRGFSVDNLENMRRFYNAYSISETISRKSIEAGKGFQPIDSPKKKKAVSAKNSISETISRKSIEDGQGFQPIEAPVFSLGFSHYIFLSRIDNIPERKFYEIEATNENWTVNELKRQYDTSLYERLALSRNKKKVKELSTKGHIITKPIHAIKDPYVLEFLDLEEQDAYSENDLESALISKLEHFLNELGKGFLFVGRQHRIMIDGEPYKVDLVFYHRILRCFVLIDLKLGNLKADHLGQMQLYVGYFDEEVKEAEENKTIGIVLCKNKKESIVKYMLPKGNKQIFTSKYKTYLPDKEDLLQLMEPEPEYIMIPK